LRVVIDASSLLLRSAGVKNYFYHWLKHLRTLAGIDTIRAFPFLEEFGPLDHERSVLPPSSTYPRLAAIYLAKFGFNPLLEFCARGADVFHVSNLLRNPPRSCKVTATVHDMTCRLMPELHTPDNVKADRGYEERVLKRADGLIAVSENTRNDVIRLLGIDPRKVRTIYSGVPEEFFDAEPRKSERPYVLSVGTIEPRKNIGALLDAWAGLPASIREEFDLCLVGATGWHSEEVLARLNAGIPGVRCLGYVPEKELPGLTAGATAVVYPSLYEGFGFPVAQAMASAVPVVTSNTSSLPEVAGDGGIIVDPRSVSELRAGIELLLTSPALRERLAVNGRQRAETFRWERSARESLEFFEQICG
jgi:glycosyltransferase involved in cell wall biosynthesis